MSNLTEMTDASSAGPSAWERDLYAHLTSHVEAERGLLQEYRSAAQTSPSKALRYLVDLLIEDEIRHHRIFTELAESLKNDALLKDTDPSIPYIDFDQTSNR
jgi:rubrerythrin